MKNKFETAVQFNMPGTSLRDLFAGMYRTTANMLNSVTEFQETCGSSDLTVNYFSAEFLMGRMLHNTLINMGYDKEAHNIAAKYDVRLSDICDNEPDMALGNGGLGRLAACYMDSLATEGVRAFGYGIHYDHGLFKQSFENGEQKETPDAWRDYGCEFERARQDLEVQIPIFGHVIDLDGGRMWVSETQLKGVPWDIPVVGYMKNQKACVNILRLWEARPTSPFNFDEFNKGYFAGSFSHVGNHLTKVLYPNDDTRQGKQLRLMQQYFFCACSILDIVRREGVDGLSTQRIQLNDTHPAVSIPELMRQLMDFHKKSWDEAWAICQRVFCYTNHTLLQEALEKWDVHLFRDLLPRHYEIIEEINRRQLLDVPTEYHHGMSIIADGMVHMGRLCVVGSRRVNGVAAMHSELVKTQLFPLYYERHPEKFVNVTNGVTPRRWVKACNPLLAEYFDHHYGDGWELNGFYDVNVENGHDLYWWQQIKYLNKKVLAEEIEKLTGVEVDYNYDAIFDVQIKRIHEYKRQQLMLMHIVYMYLRLLENPQHYQNKRVCIFAGKAAPGYKMAKHIIKAINKIADVINHDERIEGMLKVVFLPNYSVSLAEKIIPAADLSEQISLAGYEASGTGNMKLAMNGALTIGTWDGANAEMFLPEHCGTAANFPFGMTVDGAEQMNHLRGNGYVPNYQYNAGEIFDFIEKFSPELANNLRYEDPYMCRDDFDSYVQAQYQVDFEYSNQEEWIEKSIRNATGMAYFNSDRSIRDYRVKVWN